MNDFSLSFSVIQMIICVRDYMCLHADGVCASSFRAYHHTSTVLHVDMYV